MTGVDDGSLGGDDGDGAGDAVVVEDVFCDEAAEGVEGGRERDGEVGVDAAGGLGVGAGEVYGGVVAGDGEGAGAWSEGQLVVAALAERNAIGGDGGREGLRGGDEVVGSDGHARLDVVALVGGGL